MAFGGHLHSIILLSLILIFGIIHLGVGIGIVAKYHDYATVFQQQIGLSGYNIFVALLTIMISSLGLFSVSNGYSRLSKYIFFLYIEQLKYMREIYCRYNCGYSCFYLGYFCICISYYCTCSQFQLTWILKKYNN